jgi:putative DNA primase/helicase
VNEAIRRRFNLIPFNVVIPKKERDSKLGAKLYEEASGILAWMIRGCLEWQQMGLAPPEVVAQATEEYMQSEDIIGAFIEDCCVRDAQAFSKSSDLFASWRAWAESVGQYAWSESVLIRKLQDAGFVKHRPQSGPYAGKRGILGLRLARPEARPADHELAF